MAEENQRPSLIVHEDAWMWIDDESKILDIRDAYVSYLFGIDGTVDLSEKLARGEEFILPRLRQIESELARLRAIETRKSFEDDAIYVLRDLKENLDARIQKYERDRAEKAYKKKRQEEELEQRRRRQKEDERRRENEERQARLSLAAMKPSVLVCTGCAHPISDATRMSSGAWMLSRRYRIQNGGATTSVNSVDIVDPKTVLCTPCFRK